MSHDYIDQDDFDGFSDHESQVYFFDEVPDDDTRLCDDDDDDDDEAAEAASDSDDEPKDYTGFIDDEASEADSDFAFESKHEPTYAIIPSTFHKFKTLPVELREMIWQTFCPDLSLNPRVYELNFDNTILRFAAQVEDQTAPLRTVLAVHRESRALGHKYAPDLLQLQHGLGVAPCHMERDVVLVEWPFDHRYCPGHEELATLGEAAPGLQNLAIRAGITFFDGGPDLERLYSLKNIFVSCEADDISARGLTWCLSDKIHSYHMVHQEDMGIGMSENVDILFYWPDPDKYDESGERSFSSRNFASLQFDQEGNPVDAEGERISDDPPEGLLRVSSWGYEIARLREWLDPLHGMNQSSAEQSRSGSSEPETEAQNNEKAQEEEGEEGEEGHGEDHEREEGNEGNEVQSIPPQPHRISVWPFTRFMFASGMDRLEAMKAWQKPWEEWESDREQEEYEEDESEIDSDDSLHDFIAADETIDPETDDDGDASSPSLDVEDDTGRIAQGQQHLNSETADEDESSTEAGGPSQARPKNRVVIDLADSSEGEQAQEDETTAPQRAGTSSRRARVRARPIPVDSDDDDDGDLPQPSRAGPRRAAVLSSDSEDDDDEGISGHQNGASKAEKSSSEDEEEDGSDEDVPPPPPKMSLAKRLRLEAAQARAAALAAEDSDDEHQDRDGGAWDDEEDVSNGSEMAMGIAEEDEEDEEGW